MSSRHPADPPSEPVIVVLGSHIVGWNLPLWPSFLLLTGLSFAVILGIPRGVQ